jgi:hypothetical protein
VKLCPFATGATSPRLLTDLGESCSKAIRTAKLMRLAETIHRPDIISMCRQIECSDCHKKTWVGCGECTTTRNTTTTCADGPRTGQHIETRVSV